MKRCIAIIAGTSLILTALFACASSGAQPESTDGKSDQVAHTSTTRVSRKVDMPTPQYEEGYEEPAAAAAPVDEKPADDGSVAEAGDEDRDSKSRKDSIIAGDKDKALSRLPDVTDEEKKTLESLEALQNQKRDGTSAVLNKKATAPAGQQEDELEDLARSLEDIKSRKAGRAALNQDLMQAFSTADEIELGKGVSARILKETPEFDDAALWEYVTHVGLTLADVCPRNDLTYYFMVLDSDEINAFSAPGGFVFITRGAVKFCTNEAELASILAHEIAHIALRHSIRSLDKAKYRLMSKDALAEMDENMPDRDAAFKKMVEELSAIGDDCYKMTQNPYNQEMEIEADSAALTYLSKAGYNPFAAISLMDRLRMQAGKKFEYTKALTSHPHPEKRSQCMREAMSKKGIRGSGKFNQKRFEKHVR